MSNRAVVITFLSTLIVVIAITGVVRLVIPSLSGTLAGSGSVSERYPTPDGQEVAPRWNGLGEGER